MSTPDIHESPIKTPKQLITIVMLCFIIPITLLILLANWVDSGIKPQAGLSQKQMLQRTNLLIKPIAHQVYKTADEARTGEQIYTEVCASCHAAGLMNAPKFGDSIAWANRLNMGLNALVASAIKGKNAMPAKGGNPDLSEADIQNAVIYIANASGANFKAPAVNAPIANLTSINTQAINNTVTSAVPILPPVVKTTMVSASETPQSIPVNSGKQLYDTICMGCHAAGVAGAPKFGDKAAWASRSAKGMDALLASVIKGKGIMAARGGSQASDADLKQAVQYMLAAAK